MNDLEDEIRSNVLKFADDTKIFRELKGNKDCSIIQSDLDKLVCWSQRWQMAFNVKKCSDATIYDTGIISNIAIVRSYRGISLSR